MQIAIIAWREIVVVFGWKLLSEGKLHMCC